MNCEIIRDLLSLYTEELCSEASKKEVEAHLLTCEDCRREYERLKRPVEIPRQENTEEAEVLKTISGKIRRHVVGVASLTAGIAVFILLMVVALVMDNNNDYELFAFTILMNVLPVSAFILCVPAGFKRKKWAFVLPFVCAAAALGISKIVFSGYWVGALYGAVPSVFGLLFGFSAEEMNRRLDGKKFSRGVLLFSVITGGLAVIGIILSIVTNIFAALPEILSVCVFLPLAIFSITVWGSLQNKKVLKLIPVFVLFAGVLIVFLGSSAYILFATPILSFLGGLWAGALVKSGERGISP